MKKAFNYFKLSFGIICLIVSLILDILFDLKYIQINNFKLIILLPLTLIPYLLLSYDQYITFFKKIKNKDFFDEVTLTLIATIAAFSILQFVEGLAVITFFKLGSYIEQIGYKKSQDSMKSIMSLRPENVTIYKDNKELVVDPYDVDEGDIFIVKPGERIALDGVVIKGSSELDTSSMTGESLLKSVTVNDEVISGSININSLLYVKATAPFYNSTLSQVLEMVENATNSKTKEEKFINKFAKFYTPIVVILALLVAILPPLIIKYNDLETWKTYIYYGASFLVVSCPCSLLISVPMAYFVSIGHASKYKAIIKGSVYLEKINKMNTVVLDKTGTITKGNFEVTSFKNYTDSYDVLFLARVAENYSNHPIANAIKNKINVEINNGDITEFKEIEGKGISTLYKNKSLLVGNDRLFLELNKEILEISETGTKLYVYYDDIFIGYIVVKDVIKESSLTAIDNFYKNNVNNIYMLTGDNEEIANEIATACNINHVYSSLLPNEKSIKLKEIMSENKKYTTAYVGDGINDAICLKEADIGFSMGLKGSEAARESSDVILMNDDLNTINKIKKLSKSTISIVYQNIIFSIGIKVIILILTALGLLNTYAMWFAIFGDVGVTLICILNSLRIMLKKL